MWVSGIIASAALIGILMILALACGVLVVLDKRFEAGRHD